MPQPTIQGNTALAQPNSSEVKAAQAQALPTQKADPLKEYVAGGPLSYLQDYYRALPQYIDDITSDFGPDIYDACSRTARLRVLLSL
jgi:hypothetical protein